MKRRAEYEGVGVYERIDRPRPSEELLWGVYAQSGLGQVPGSAELLAPLLDTEETSGLIVVRNDVRPMAVAALEAMAFQPDSAVGADPVTGQASFVALSVGGPWVRRYVDEGYMVLVNLASVSTGSPRLMMTRSAETIAYYATTEGGYAMVTGPQELAVEAMKLKTAPSLPECPAGTVVDTDTGECVPVTAAPGPPAEPAPTAAAAAVGAPGWLVPAAVAAGVLVVGYLALDRYYSGV